MKTFNGYKKKNLTDSNLLLAGSGHKPLNELLTDLSRPTNTDKISITVGGNTLLLDLGARAWDSTAYLPLSGGIMTGHITMSGLEIYFGKSGVNAILSYNSSYPKYGIWYNDTTVDLMMFSASGNADDASKADLAINGNGDGTVTIRGNTVIHSGNIGSQSVNYASSAGSATTATRFEYITNWSSPKNGANVINLMSDISDSATTNGAPARYTSGISIVTNYVGFQLASYGGGGESLYFRKLQDNGTWHSWYEVITAANIGSQSVNYATSAGSASIASLLRGADNRSTNSAPSVYMSKGAASVYAEFSQSGGAASGYSGYGCRVTFTPWGDASGGRPVQFEFNDQQVYIRGAASNDAWNSWRTIINSGNYSSYALPLSGGTMTGRIYTASNIYSTLGGSNSGVGALHLNNSDITGVNAISTNDVSDDWTESLAFKRSNGNWDSFRAKDGTFYFGVNNGTEYTAIHTGNYTSYCLPKSGGTMTGQLYINLDQDVGLNQNGSLVIGSKGGENLAFDGNEIMARSNSAASTLYLNSEGGQVYIGRGGINSVGTIYQNGTAVSLSGHTHSYLPLSGGTMTGNLTIAHATSATMTASSSNPKITFSESGTLPVHLTYTDYDAYRNPAGLKVVGGTDASPAWFEAEGNMYASNFYTTSDRSKKQNISSFSEHIRKFQLKDTEKWHYGVIAQEVPEMFRDGEEGNMTVNYNSVLSYYIGLLENKVKELEDKIKLLENKN